MLEIYVPENEIFNEVTNSFIPVKGVTIHLEHSLISLSKWESKYEKPFLVDDDKTNEEIMDYIRFMTITKNVNPMTYYVMTQENLTMIEQYIDAKMTATTIEENPNDRYGPRRNILTNEVIYAMMVEFGIPFECERWHLNRLIMLIRVCKARSTPQQKIPQKEMLAKRRALNEKRLKEMKGRK